MVGLFFYINKFHIQFLLFKRKCDLTLALEISKLNFEFGNGASNYRDILLWNKVVDKLTIEQPFSFFKCAIKENLTDSNTFINYSLMFP